MSNNDTENNNFDDVDFDTQDAGFDDFGTSKSSGTLGDVWRNNPMVKVGAVLAVLAVIVGGAILFGGGEQKEAPSELRAAPVETKTGETQNAIVSDVYRQEIEKLNEEKIEAALAQQSSALPLSTDPARGRIAPIIEETAQEDPLERWRELQEQRRRSRPNPTEEQLGQEPPRQPEVDTRAQAVTALSQAMSTQMESILEGRKIPEMKLQEITPIDYLEDKAAEREEERRAEEEARNAETEEEGEEIILLPAGEVEFAQMITEANSDTPGPILAQILSGPLKGARALGEFTVEGDYLILSFNRVVLDGIDYDADAVALDPSTAGVGVATEVDQRYFTRVVLPAAADFVEGFASAVAQSESTTVTVNDSSTSSTEEDLDTGQEVASGFESLGREVGETFDEIANQTRPLVRVDPGTEIGILFVEPVIQE